MAWQQGEDRMRAHAGAAEIALWATAAMADEATIYRDQGFSGPAVAIERANPDLKLGFPIQSIRVRSGTWELCPERNFRGRCLTVTGDTVNLRAAYGWQGRLQSIRPVADSGWGGPGGGGGGGGQQQSLRGMASEYFPRPYEGGRRVPACPRGSATAACAQENANSFCKRAGWTRSAYQRIETERGTNYLTDVLCVRSMT
jgi:hypothetical protein